MEVYIDDMLVKSVKAKLHVAHLDESFQILKNYNMKVNRTKCAFGVSVGKFLGFMVNSRGIEEDPDKIKVMLDMHPPSNTKEIQRLTGRIAALSCFVSRSKDKCRPFFQVLKKAFHLDAQCEEAFSVLNSPSRSGKSLRGRTPYPLFGRFRFLNQGRPCQRAKWNTTTSLLLQPSFEGSEGKVSKDGEVNPSIGDHCQKVLTIFPGSHY